MHSRRRAACLSISVVLFLCWSCAAAPLEQHVRHEQPSSSSTTRPHFQHPADNRKPVPLRHYTVNLDAPAETRWSHIVPDFKAKIPAIIAYLHAFVPKWALPIVDIIGKDIEGYFHLYGKEMKGLASDMGLPEGQVVMLNLIYQLESLGLNCSNWNNTGPTRPNDPGCTDVDPKQKWCYCKKHSDRIDENGILAPLTYDPTAPGLCTSVVAQDPSGHIWHGRNLDWNLPPALLDLAIDIDFQRNGTTLYRGTTLLGFVGLMNGMVKGAFTASIDARGKGGKVFSNLVEALFHRGMTPAQHLRYSFETQSSFSGAVNALSNGPLIDQVYFIVGGAAPGQGVVISRDRKNTFDQWKINATATNGWFRLQTNYDHWNPVPKADDRRTPGVAHMVALGQGNLGIESVFDVMKAWPTYNDHTDYTGVFAAFNGTYISHVWK